MTEIDRLKYEVERLTAKIERVRALAYRYKAIADNGIINDTGNEILDSLLDSTDPWRAAA